jgi:hypothetical protein
MIGMLSRFAALGVAALLFGGPPATTAPYTTPALDCGPGPLAGVRLKVALPANWQIAETEVLRRGEKSFGVELTLRANDAPKTPPVSVMLDTLTVERARKGGAFEPGYTKFQTPQGLSGCKYDNGSKRQTHYTAFVPMKNIRVKDWPDMGARVSISQECENADKPCDPRAVSALTNTIVTSLVVQAAQEKKK